jgi:hypothetical protein
MASLQSSSGFIAHDEWGDLSSMAFLMKLLRESLSVCDGFMKMGTSIYMPFTFNLACFNVK